MTECLNCGRTFDAQDDSDRIASISGGFMGDEYTESYLLCRTCDVYTVDVFYEPFLGEDRETVRGPLTRAEGDAKVALIRQCPKPWSKRCRCAAHMEYWQGRLD